MRKKNFEMKEPGRKNDYLIPWGLKKIKNGWNLKQTKKAINKMRKKKLSEIKELVKT